MRSEMGKHAAAPGGAHARVSAVRFRAVPALCCAALAVVLCALGVLFGARAIGAESGGVPALSADDGSEVSLTQTAGYRKTEVVYAALDAAGAQESSYVVNQFEVKTPGRVVDYGDYDGVKNLTSTDALRRANGATVFDVIEPGVFYYEGDSDRMSMPWKVSVEFLLDGQRVGKPADLAGASGELQIRVRTQATGGVDRAFYDSFLQQITVTLSGDLCSDIRAEGATVASSGSNRTIAFTALPGHDADCTVTATVHDFEMPGIQIAALPYSSFTSMPDTSELAGGMQQLVDAIAALNVGAGGLSDGAGQLASGVSQLNEGLSGFDPAQLGVFVALAKDALALSSATLYDVQMMDAEELYCLGGNFDALADFLEWLRDLDPDEVKLPDRFCDFDFDAAIAKCRAIAGFLQRNAVQLAELMESASDPAKAAEISSQLSELSDGLVSLKDGVLQLNDGARQLADGAQQYATGMREFNDGAAGIPDEMASQIEAMTAEFSFPEFEPHSFVSAKNDASRMANVQFVLQTAPIEKTKAAAAPEESASKGFLDRLLALFGR